MTTYAQSDFDIAKEIRARAIAHKRQSRRHRELARLEMERLRQFCASHDIELIMVTKGDVD